MVVTGGGGLLACGKVDGDEVEGGVGLMMGVGKRGIQHYVMGNAYPFPFFFFFPGVIPIMTRGNLVYSCHCFYLALAQPNIMNEGSKEYI